MKKMIIAVALASLTAMSSAPASAACSMWSGTQMNCSTSVPSPFDYSTSHRPSTLPAPRCTMRVVSINPTRTEWVCN